MFQECCAKFESDQDKPEMTMNLPFLPPSSVESDQISALMSLPSAIASVATGQTGNFFKVLQICLQKWAHLPLFVVKCLFQDYVTQCKTNVVFLLTKGLKTLVRTFKSYFFKIFFVPKINVRYLKK